MRDFDICVDCRSDSDLLTLGGEYLCHACNAERWRKNQRRYAAEAGLSAIEALEAGNVTVAEFYARESMRHARLAEAR